MPTTIEFLRSSLHLVRMLRSQPRPFLASIHNVYCASPIMPKRAAPASSSSSAPAATASNPLSIDYAQNPTAYRILRGEMNVFKTNPYSAELKPLWRFKDEAAARKSSEALWERFVGYRDKRDFVGMDVTRKFLQMGYTRSTRYALRPSGRKYNPSTGAEMSRTGEIWDEEKYRGASVFKDAWKRVEGDEMYASDRARWEVEVEGKRPKVKSKTEFDPNGVNGHRSQVENEDGNKVESMHSHQDGVSTGSHSRRRERNIKVEPLNLDQEQEQDHLRSIKEEENDELDRIKGQKEAGDDEVDEDVKPAKRQKTSRSCSSSKTSPKRETPMKAKTGKVAKSRRTQDGSKRQTRSDGPVKVEPEV